MPKFFFDTHDGDLRSEDDVGIELAGPDEARLRAAAGLADVAKDALPDGVSRTIAIEVRGENSVRLIRASIDFRVEEIH